MATKKISAYARNTILLDTDGIYLIEAIDTVPVSKTMTIANARKELAGLIQEQLLGVDVASVSFTSIPQNFRHLKLIIYGRTTEVTVNNYFTLRFNNDSGANYDFQQALITNATTSFSSNYAQTSGRIGDFPGASAARATQVGSAEILIPHYTGTTFEKNAICHSGQSAGISGNNLSSVINTIFWRSAVAITRIDIFPSANNIKAGSIISLYGTP